MTKPLHSTLVLLLLAAPACAQSTSDPFPEPIETEQGAIVVDVREFASIPDQDGEAARVMTLVAEPGGERIFVSEMRGPVYTVSPDGRAVTEYLDVDDPRWNVQVQSSGRERGVQSVALHPEFNQAGAPGQGKIYVWTDTRNTEPPADFRPSGDDAAQHTVLLEFTAETPGAERYDGGPPRELARFEQPFGNHNGGQIDFSPLPGPDDPDFGMLYVGVGDGGAGGDPYGMAQDLSSGFGKILRIDPLGSGGRTGEYGIPADNPFVDEPGALPEIWALGLRNPQHLAWDPATGDIFVADIGQNTVEEVSPVSRGANLGWNVWEGSFRFEGRGGVSTSDPRSDPEMTYPVAEYDHADPLLTRRAAVTGLRIYREDRISSLQGLLLFGDLPSGEIFWVNADDLPSGGQERVRRVLLRGDDGRPRRLLELVQATNRAQGRDPASRVDLRMGSGPDGRVFLLNKHDGVIRVLVPGG